MPVNTTVATTGEIPLRRTTATNYTISSQILIFPPPTSSTLTMRALAPMWNIEEPDTLLTRERTPLLDKLIERNLVVDDIPPRTLWIDTPPPEKAPELEIGKHAAW